MQISDNAAHCPFGDLEFGSDRAGGDLAMMPDHGQDRPMIGDEGPLRSWAHGKLLLCGIQRIELVLMERVER
jgi:hypothetical protein